MRDPILDAIEALETGLAYFRVIPTAVTEKIEEQIIAVTYGPPLEVLSEWTAPAETLEGAVAAIRFAAKELSGGGTDIAERMLNAAIAYFDAIGDGGDAK